MDTQGTDGRWPEALFTGTGFPRHFYLRYCWYPAYFPLMALGQIRAALAARSTDFARARDFSPAAPQIDRGAAA